MYHKVRGRPNLCITSEIRELMRTRDQWRKLARRSNDPLAWAGYRNYKQEVKREIRLAERQFVTEQIANNANNPGSIFFQFNSNSIQFNSNLYFDTVKNSSGFGTIYNYITIINNNKYVSKKSYL